MSDREEGTAGETCAPDAPRVFFFLPTSRAHTPLPTSFPVHSPGPTLDVPSTVTPPQLEALVNSVKGASVGDDDNPTLPYAFSVAGSPLAGPAAGLGPHLAAAAASLEGATLVTCRPQAPFRVRPVTRCAASLPGHTESVLAVAFSPDGARLASGSGDTTVRLWDLSTSGPLAVLGGHAGWVLALAWSPDGRYLASGGMDAGVLVWDGGGGGAAGRKGGEGGDGAAGKPAPLPAGTVARPAPLGACKGHTKWVTCLAWEPLHAAGEGGCRRLATGSKDTTIKVRREGEEPGKRERMMRERESTAPPTRLFSSVFNLTPLNLTPPPLTLSTPSSPQHRSGTPPPASA